MAFGHIYHTIRYSNSWQPWGNVSNTVQGSADRRFYMVACATVGLGNKLHIIALNWDTWALYHTIRYSDGTPWQPWGNVTDNAGNDLSIGLSGIDCAGDGEDLHIVASSGNRNHVYHTIRYAGSYSWKPVENVNFNDATSPDHFHTISCAMIGVNLHVVTIAENAHEVFHSILSPNYSPGPYKKLQGWFPVSVVNAHYIAGMRYIDCAGVGNDLHIVAVDGAGNVLHTIRFADDTWQDWHNVSTEVANNPGPIKFIGCAGIGNDLHVVGSTYPGFLRPAGVLYHTIRYSDGRPWQPWGNVNLAAGYHVPGPGNILDFIHCASYGGDLHVIGAEFPDNANRW